jgi:predicted amidohydrolase
MEDRMATPFKAYALQFDACKCEFGKNLRKIELLLSLCEDNSLVVLPEVAQSEFCYEDIEGTLSSGTELLSLLSSVSERRSMTIVVSLFERINGKLFNSVKVIEKGKEILSRPKVKLFKLAGEDKYFTSGSFKELAVAESQFGVIAPLICFEIRFYEILKRLKELGGEIFTVSAQWGRARREHWELFVKTRAVELQRFFIAANGKSKEMAGSSLIVDPWGRVLGYAGDCEGVIKGEVSLSLIAQVEKKLPLESTTPD